MSNPPDLTQVLAKFKEDLTASVPDYNPQEHSDDLLLRFLKARKYDLKKSHEMFSEYLAWRKSFGVEDIVQNLAFPEFNKVVDIYPRYYHKTDKQGRPVYVEVMSNLTAKMLDGSVTTPERFVQYYVREYEKTLRYRFPALSLKAGRNIDKSCTILDMKNVPLMQFNSIRKVMSQVAHISQNYYPETLGKIRTCFVPRCLGCGEGMLDENTVAKISILGSSYKKELLEVIDAANLPAELGGTCECPKGCRHSDMGPWNDGSVPGYPIEFWETINLRNVPTTTASQANAPSPK
ncbi:CRAL/TRIO domain-containing protein [Rhizoclosmatium globosum]|uniref:CRAL/TRIO domain-containing protein n=1 Tax=Rhizoclosmatium globosum TaxID=329046 RepID=A0A1Y2CBF7_9FUNG|nr:CRAL/TRIO domain-containing protein [Rhizoclosmatium globosum]|eukprot:ORY43665.1 CRAL/TRIO domain-containing protein [Rhizoclosmatium globosum]